MKMMQMMMMKMMMMMMMANNGRNLLPALLWVPAVSPRAVMVTTGLDTLEHVLYNCITKHHHSLLITIVQNMCPSIVNRLVPILDKSARKHCRRTFLVECGNIYHLKVNFVLNSETNVAGPKNHFETPKSDIFKMAAVKNLNILNC